MTMVACGISEWPRPLMGNFNASTGGAGTTYTLDSTTDALAWVGKPGIAGDLAILYFRTGTIPAGGGDTVDVRIETVANGRPTGTLWAANTNVTVAIADTDDQLWKTATLTAPATLTLTSEIAIVIISSAGTPAIVLLGATGFFSGGGLGQYPVLLQNATGAYAVVSSGPPFEWIASFTTIGIKYLPGLTPVDGALTLTAFNSGSTPNARALRFRVPYKCRCVGARVFIGNIAAAGDFTVSLFDAVGVTDAAALGQATIDGDFPAATTSDGYVDVMFDEVDADNVLTINTTYYIELRPDSTNSVTLFEVPTAGTGQPAGSLAALPSGSTELFLATRTWAAGTAGVWSTTTTTQPIIALLIDQLDDGAGGGGLLTHPGMVGGMRG